MQKELSAQSRNLIALGREKYVPNYNPRELIVDHARGARVWDLDGNEYIDLGTGISVNSLGHQNPELMDALIGQAGKIWHTSNIYFTEPAIRLAEKLIELTFADRVFFSNSGAEANEAAIKMARKYASLHYPADKREIITFNGSFHGRTMATMTATAQPKYQQGFEPLPGGFRYCPYNDFDAIAASVSEKTCAVLLEPLQGEGGVTPAAEGFLSHVRALCDQHKALMVLDEVQTGIGRTGQLFAYQWEDNFCPDILTSAKALGGGLPIGATLAVEDVAQALQFGSHGSTFGGNPLATAVARVVLDQAANPALLEHVRQMGEHLVQRLREMGKDNRSFAEVRGKGLMIGVQLQGAAEGKAGDIAEACRQAGVLILQAGPDVLRFLPPLTISKADLDAGLDALATVIGS